MKLQEKAELILKHSLTLYEHKDLIRELLADNAAKQALIENYDLDMLMDIFKSKLEESIVETFKSGRGDAAAQCYQIASSHEFGPDAAKTIRETFGLEI